MYLYRFTSDTTKYILQDTRDISNWYYIYNKYYIRVKTRTGRSRRGYFQKLIDSLLAHVCS